MAAQQQFSGISTSQRVGLLNAGINPAELANTTSKYEIHGFSASINASNNKIGFSDLVNGSDLSELIFQGSDAVNLRFDAEINGPGIAYKMNKWTFGFTTKAYAKLDLVDVDVHIGDAVTNSALNSIAGSTTISNNYNQRLNGTTWGEIGLSAARNLFEDEHHKFSVGATFKLLFPGSYANLGANQFNGTINNNLGNVTLTNAQANLNIAYSGNLGNNFTSFSDYSESLFGGLNGFGADIGLNYQMKDSDNEHYKINTGLAIRNMGSMTFRDADNSSTNYLLSIQGLESLNLNQFEGVNSLQEIETILLNSGYLQSEVKTKNFKVKLPTLFSAYADIKIIPTFYVTLYGQQKMNKDDQNDQITNQNSISLTPRYSLKNYEVWSTWASNEISGTTGGLGFRIYGFFVGSGSVVTALISDTKQADVYIGYSFGLK